MRGRQMASRDRDQGAAPHPLMHGAGLPTPPGIQMVSSVLSAEGEKWVVRLCRNSLITGLFRILSLQGSMALATTVTRSPPGPGFPVWAQIWEVCPRGPLSKQYTRECWRGGLGLGFPPTVCCPVTTLPNDWVQVLPCRLMGSGGSEGTHTLVLSARPGGLGTPGPVCSGACGPPPPPS